MKIKNVITLLLTTLCAVISARAAEPKVFYVYARAWGKTHCGSETTVDYVTTTMTTGTDTTRELYAAELRLEAILRERNPNAVRFRSSSSGFDWSFTSPPTHVAIMEWTGGSATCPTRIVTFHFGRTLEEASAKAKAHFDLWAPSTATMKLLEHGPVTRSTGAGGSGGDQVLGRPDASIGLTPGSMLGKDFYDSEGRGQFGRAKLGQRPLSCFIWVQNAGQTSDLIAVKGSKGSANITVRYIYNGTNVTSKVVAGTFQFSPLPPGEGQFLKAIVSAKAGIKPRKQFDLKVDTTSDQDPLATDRVMYRFTTK